jgi:hypothetical protein
MEKKMFHITLILGHTHREINLLADDFSGSTLPGAYTFYLNKKIIACYPIERTVIMAIEKKEEE